LRGNERMGRDIALSLISDIRPRVEVGGISTVHPRESGDPGLFDVKQSLLVFAINTNVANRHLIRPLVRLNCRNPAYAGMSGLGFGLS
jgi:hypothetical protein